jgi:hypothetical protein
MELGLQAKKVRYTDVMIHSANIRPIKNLNWTHICEAMPEFALIYVPFVEDDSWRNLI